MRDYKSLTLSVPCFPPAFFALGVVWAVAPETTLREQLHLFFVCLWLEPELALDASQGHLLFPDREVIEKTFIFNAYRISEGLVLAIQESFTPKLIKNRTLPQEWLIWVWAQSWLHVKRTNRLSISIFIYPLLGLSLYAYNVLGQFHTVEFIYIYTAWFNYFYSSMHHQKNWETTD